MIQVEIPAWHDLCQAYVETKDKYAVCVNLHYDPNTDTRESFREALDRDLPFWRDYWPSEADVLVAAVHEYPAIFLMDTEQEMRELYEQVRGDDARPPGRFYAMYVYPNGFKGLDNAESWVAEVLRTHREE
jgi:hypothetical protein